MAITGQLTLNQILIVEVDSDPSVGGVTAPIGSLALLDDAVNGKIWIKSGSGDTAWSIVPRLASGTAFTTGSIVFSDSSGFFAQNNGQLFWDNSNSRLGLGIVSPQAHLHLDAGNATAHAIKLTVGTTTGTTAGDGFEFGVDTAGNGEIRQRENSLVSLFTNNTQAAAITNAQRFLISSSQTSQQSAAGEDSHFQVHGINAQDSQISLMRWSADASSSILRLTKSRAAAIGTHTALLAADYIGSLSFRGSDGTAFFVSSAIAGQAESNFATNSVPGRLVFFTTPSASTTSLERMRIASTGQIVLNGQINPVDVVGTTILPQLQVVGTTAANAQIATIIYSADNVGSYHLFAKSRNATPGSHTIVSADDSLGRIQWKGSDGLNFQSAAEIRAFVDGTPGTGSMPARIGFYTSASGGANPLERMRIDSNGKVIVGTGAVVQDITGLSIIPVFQILSATAGEGQMVVGTYTADANPSVANLIKSRGALNAQGLVQSGDDIGRLQFRGSDGVNFQAAASVRGTVDGTAAANSMPGRLSFWTTPTGSISPVERVRIDQAGNMGLGNISPTRLLDVNGTIRIRGGSPRQGMILQASNTNGDADWTDDEDIGNQYNFTDDFIQSYVSTTYLGFSWIPVANGGTVNAADNTSVDPLHPGTITLVNSAVNQRPTLYMSVGQHIVGNGTTIVQWLIKTPATLPTAAQNYLLRVGMGDDISNTVNDFVDGTYFEFPVNGTTAIQCKTSSNSTRTTTTSGVNWAVNTWYMLTMTITSTSVVFNINGTDVVTTTTNIPTGAGRNCGPIIKYMKTLGATALTWTVDAFRFSQYFSGTRY